MFQHFSQVNPFCCGAACMQMVYDHFGITISQDILWAYISRLNPRWGLDCGPEQMQRHFHANGLCALYAVDIMDIDLFFTWIERHSLSAIVNYSLGEDHRHFVLFEHSKSNGIIIQDPSEQSPNTHIPFDLLVDPQIMLVASPAYLAKCPCCSSAFPSCDIFAWLYARHIARCAYCQNELIYTLPITERPLSAEASP